ncbi:MAG: hypothetical protein KatS3mg131_3234 [Candidatus Tectimicrobiota bacterium]|nr:MAG: hypothetical protein KatS3mg131_3234 [Candidatus Tectomicrobia bacterium]
MKSCPLCHTEMPARYNYCYQCGEYVGHLETAAPDDDPAAAKRHRLQERFIHYGCLTLILMWTAFGLWFLLHINR